MGIKVTNPEDVRMLYDLTLTENIELYGGYVDASTGFFAVVPYRGGWYVVIHKGDEYSAFGYRSEDEARGHFDDLVAACLGELSRSPRCYPDRKRNGKKEQMCELCSQYASPCGEHCLPGRHCGCALCHRCGCSCHFSSPLYTERKRTSWR